MPGVPSDTSPEAERRQIEILRGLGIAERARITFELNDNLDAIVEAGVRSRHPEWDQQQVMQEVLRLVVGDHLFQQIFGDDRTR
ncbi:MAG: hypothetical protein JSU94_12840 [Phycisphaerales bacterium]|nr:MAG: hypothetical protein JSU94_12840 [Phycisphaerales bacterium]